MIKTPDENINLTYLEDTFLDFFLKQGYKILPSIPVSSGFDPSVRFIGSHISVMKPRMENHGVPLEGLVMKQPCIRTQGVKYLQDETYQMKYASYFMSLGVLVPISQLDPLCYNAHHFLNTSLGIKEEDAMVRINSEDEDLIKVAETIFKSYCLEIDSRPKKYYQHKIGFDDMAGRNFNIAIKNTTTKTFEDIGNVIIWESDNKQSTVELAIGSSVLWINLNGLDHVLDAYPLSGYVGHKIEGDKKLQDALMVSVLLYQEGLRPSSKSNRNRILKKYLQAIKYWQKINCLDDDFISRLLAESQRFWPHNIQEGLEEEIMTYLKKLDC